MTRIVGGWNHECAHKYIWMILLRDLCGQPNGFVFDKLWLISFDIIFSIDFAVQQPGTVNNYSVRLRTVSVTSQDPSEWLGGTNSGKTGNPEFSLTCLEFPLTSYLASDFAVNQPGTVNNYSIRLRTVFVTSQDHSEWLGGTNSGKAGNPDFSLTYWNFLWQLTS